MLSFYAVYAAWSDKKEWIKCVEIWVVAGLPWPHVQFQPQMGLMGGPGLCVAHFPPDIATQGNLKSSRKKVWSGQVSDSFQSLLFFSTTRIGLYKSTGLLILLGVKSSNRTQMKLPGGGTFLGKLYLHDPQTLIYATVSKYIHSATLGALWTQTSGSFAVITDPLHLLFHFYADFNIKGYR